MVKKLTAIPTNLILGFLGAGKTTAILNLLAQKPANETWAVLVNEFGKVGIDGAILRAQGAVVSEVAGGCLCCATGVPFQVAVNRLLKTARPDRLLIEPTGLGHPYKLLETLNTGYFREVLALRATICLLDPAKLKDNRYQRHQTFVDQIALADILIANKTDIADADALQLFDKMAEQCQPAKTVVAKTRQGKLDISWLDVAADSNRCAQYPNAHALANANINAGFQSRGWFFASEQLFNYRDLCAFFEQLSLQRLKGVLTTDEGCFIFNADQGQMTITPVSGQQDNRLEMIADQANWNDIEIKLNQCLMKNGKAEF